MAVIKEFSVSYGEKRSYGENKWLPIVLLLVVIGIAAAVFHDSISGLIYPTHQAEAPQG